MKSLPTFALKALLDLLVLFGAPESWCTAVSKELSRRRVASRVTRDVDEFSIFCAEVCATTWPGVVGRA